MSETNREDKFIPCTVPVNAVFKDRESYPVICWRVEDISDNDEDMPNGYFLPVGLIIQEGSKHLVDACEMDGFIGYEYA